MSRRLLTKRRGFSLPELMVAMVIGLVLVMAISTLVTRQESIRRGVSSGNDLTSNAAYAAYLLDRELRSAGAGFSQAPPENYGCVLNVSRNNTQLLPATAPFPAPFASIPQTYALAPLVVFAGAGTGGSDVLAVATGNSGLSELPLAVSPKSTAAGQLKLSNTLGMRGGDLVLLAQQGVGCMMEQVSNGFAGGTGQVLTLGGTYAADTINGKSVTDFSNGNAFVSALGNVTGNQPRFELLGLGANGTLYAYDLLQLSSNSPQALVEGIADMRVVYGVDTARGGLDQVTAWIAPTASGYTAAELTNGTSVAQANLKAILAVRISMVLRSELVEKTDVTSGTLTMFSDLDTSLQRTFTVPTGTTNQRYRLVEFTIPLRNVRLAP
ncbi:MAG: PilW family protein [Burkholderiales bacterium]|jgi:type IV pilus assembly protein PilW|nr:PilW family protein [Burkholderiales bacterium]MBW8891592.1 PilW family protein [Burkholderiales bacterium]